MEGRDYEHKCLGEYGFSYLIESLKGKNDSFGMCDIGVSGITVTSSRTKDGIMFSHPICNAKLVVMVHRPLPQRGSWAYAFFNPLHWTVWVALLGLVVVTPLIVFFFEAVFNKGCVYASSRKLHAAHSRCKHAPVQHCAGSTWVAGIAEFALYILVG